jgi:hypothetical protein
LQLQVVRDRQVQRLQSEQTVATRPAMGCFNWYVNDAMRPRQFEHPIDTYGSSRLLNDYEKKII